MAGSYSYFWDAETIIIFIQFKLNKIKRQGNGGSHIRYFLATPITSQLNFSHWDNSAIHDYAVRYENIVCIK